jgi:hypothetical protein
MFELLIIHHGHTDVGYTAPQSTVGAWQTEFIRQAIRHAETEEAIPFRWVCETFWSVERFWADADAEERERFLQAVRQGGIGLSASYLNFSELADETTLRLATARATEFAAKHELPLGCAMTADINGHGWGFAEILAKAAVENLFSCVHGHHGRHPLDRPQRGFWWEAPSGARILVWSGEHYHHGNELGLAPAAISSYLTQDDCDAAMIYGDHRAVAERRIPRYIERLRKLGHPWEFAPVMVSGLRSDNAPPAVGIREFCLDWNREHGDRIRLSMVTLDEFFARLRGSDVELPIHRGDWPDWWSDGPAGDAAAVRLHRDAQRRRAALAALALRHPEAAPGAELQDSLALFAEHTFGHADAMTQPWRLDCQAIGGRKLANAAMARDESLAAELRALTPLGARAPEPDLPLRFRAINPHAESWSGPVRLPLPHYEFNERGLHGGLRVVDPRSGAVFASRLESAAGGGEATAWLELGPGESRDLIVRPSDPEAPIDGDPVDPEAWIPAGESGVMATKHLELGWALPAGVVVMQGRPDDCELLRAEHPYPAFLPIREITPLGDDGNIYGVRGAMVRNRKGPDVEREVARVRRAWRSDREELYEALAFELDCPGLNHCRLELRSWHASPRLDIALRFMKESFWEPENVYLSLPLGPGGEQGELRLLKAGAIIRPRVEQIPGTLTDFYALQEGFVITGKAGGLALAMPDQHLLQVGSLEHGERLLADDPRLAEDPEHLHAWLMTNYWETNFAPELGGWHEFRYSMTWGAALADPARAAAACRNLARGVFCFRTGSVNV